MESKHRLVKWIKKQLLQGSHTLTPACRATLLYRCTAQMNCHTGSIRPVPVCEDILSNIKSDSRNLTKPIYEIVFYLLASYKTEHEPSKVMVSLSSLWLMIPGQETCGHRWHTISEWYLQHDSHWIKQSMDCWMWHYYAWQVTHLLHCLYAYISFMQFICSYVLFLEHNYYIHECKSLNRWFISPKS